jgi:hypothetical protein
MLAVVREGAEAQGYRVRGFAPTSRAAHKLAEAGMDTSTLQRDPELKQVVEQLASGYVRAAVESVKGGAKLGHRGGAK